MSITNRSFNAGMVARRKNKPITACKSPNPENNKAWQTGWLYMDEVLKKSLTQSENRVK